MKFDFNRLKTWQKEALIEKLSRHVTKERWAQMKRVIRERTRHVTVVLEDIYQAQNAGAVVRTCECMGVQNLYIIENRNPFNLKESKVAMGASKWVDIYYCQENEAENTLNCIRNLKQHGYKIVGMTLGEQTIPISEVPLEEPLALVIGTEKKGLSEEMAKQADYKAEIPMYGFTESFNLSVCAGISLNQITTRLRKSALPWRLDEESKRELAFRWLSQCINGVEVLIRDYVGQI